MAASISKKYNKTGLGNIVLRIPITDYIYNVNCFKYKSLRAINYCLFDFKLINTAVFAFLLLH
ncbi:hypothetical protein C9I86_05385 [Photobacterium sp. NCIMB 13483]|nr:hypothetical protein C9I86_05385 [Photobacterium sp. NCIMB 13483]